MRRVGINDLPKEIVEKIAYELQLEEIRALSQSCKRLNVTNYILWVDYFGYRTGACKDLLERFTSIISPIGFMKRHGIFILDYMKHLDRCYVDQYLRACRPLTDFFYSNISIIFYSFSGCDSHIMVKKVGNYALVTEITMMNKLTYKMNMAYAEDTIRQILLDTKLKRVMYRTSDAISGMVIITFE